MKRVKYFEKYDERGITGEYGRYFAEILLPYFETNNLQEKKSTQRIRHHKEK